MDFFQFAPSRNGRFLEKRSDSVALGAEDDFRADRLIEDRARVCALRMRSIYRRSGAFRCLRCHPLACMLLIMRSIVDSSLT